MSQIIDSLDTDYEELNSVCATLCCIESSADNLQLPSIDDIFFGNLLILDVGCGPANFVQHLKRLGLDAYGVDINASRYSYDPDLEKSIKEGDVMKGLPFDDGTFGVVTCQALLTDPDFQKSVGNDFYLGIQREYNRIVKECLRVMRGGGYLIISDGVNLDGLIRDPNLVIKSPIETIQVILKRN